MNNLIKVVVLLVLITGTAMSQTAPQKDAKPASNSNISGVYTMAEQMPSFPGGEDALMKYLQDKLKYPEAARAAKIQGKVFVSFVIKDDGKVSDVKVLRGIGGGCDEEAQRIVEAMPNWIPGKQSGKNVAVQFNLPVQFKLDNGDPLMKGKAKN